VSRAHTRERSTPTTTPPQGPAREVVDDIEIFSSPFVRTREALNCRELWRLWRRVQLSRMSPFPMRIRRRIPKKWTESPVDGMQR
jgi:hypothetical protein